MNHHDRITWATAEATIQAIRTPAVARTTGRIHSDVTAMCISVWNQVRLSGSPIAPQKPSFDNSSHESARLPTV